MFCTENLSKALVGLLALVVHFPSQTMRKKSDSGCFFSDTMSLLQKDKAVDCMCM